MGSAGGGRRPVCWVGVCVAVRPAVSERDRAKCHFAMASSSDAAAAPVAAPAAVAAAAAPLDISAGPSAASIEAELAELGLDDEFDVEEFKNDKAVQEALKQGTDLRKYADEVERALRSVERDSITDYLKESESLAGMHTEIRQCDTVLDQMESMLRGFQTDLASISAQIKYLQDESLSMNVKLRNRKAAEAQLSSFIQQIVVPPELITNICESEVNEAYLEYVMELNKKVAFSKRESTTTTTACADMAPELEKLRTKPVQKIRDFLLQRVASLKQKMTNIQILQQSVLLKYKGLYKFLTEHAPEVAVEVKESYMTTMSAIYLRHVKGYLSELMRVRVEPATKSDLLGTEEWSGSAGALAGFFSAKPATARGDGAYKVGERIQVLEQVSEAPLIPAVLQQQAADGVQYESIFRSFASLLMDTAGSEHSFMSEFFGDTDAFDQVLGKAIFHCMENLEQQLISSWDAIGCVLLLELLPKLTASLTEEKLPLLATFFQRAQVLIWSRFKAIMEAHVASLAAAAPKAAPEIHPHYVARRYAELTASLRRMRPSGLDAQMNAIHRAVRTEVERLLQDRLARHHTSRKAQAAFLVNSYELIVSTIHERGARSEESAHFEQLLDSAKAIFVEEELAVDYGAMIAYVKQTEPLLMASTGAPDISRVDVGGMEHLLRSFYDTWKKGIEAINRDVIKSFANFHLGQDILKQVLTQLLLYYTRFLDLVKKAYPNGAPFAKFILSIQTLMSEIRNFSRNF